METAIDRSKKNYFDAFDALKEVYNSYRVNQLLKPDDISVCFGGILSTEITTVGYPMASIAFLKSLREEVAVIIMPTLPANTNYEPKEICVIVSPLEVDMFCKDHGLQRALKIYEELACRIFENASTITLSLSEDPEIENYIKICLNIKIKADIQPLLRLDKEFFKTIDSIIPDFEKDFFVRTYEIFE